MLEGKIILVWGTWERGKRKKEKDQRAKSSRFGDTQSR